MVSKTITTFTVLFCMQIIYSATATPLGFGGGCGCDGGFGGFGDVGRDNGCGTPISFLPVPQPVPIRVPQPQRQSVTIPNIILALLPPNQRPAVAPRPVIRPAPVVLPLPQPFPCPVPDRCGC